MAEFGNINVSVRTKTGKGVARTIRREGLIPGVLYGAAGDNVSLTLNPHELMKATDPSRSWNTMYTLNIEDDGKAATKQAVMVCDVQLHAVRREVEHIDFMRVDPEAEVVRKIPVRFEGRPAGVVKGGKLKTYRRTVRIACKPGEVPVELLVEISGVDAGESLRMKDVQPPNGRLVEPEEARLCFVDLPKSNPEGGDGEDDAKAADA
ncbi:MAG: 50S ribosomal protein L25 [Nannocystaceae bacterium]|nr:50S ribosomal protein L25 [Nannocystaceae bacterium]